MIDRNIDKIIENHYVNNKSALLLTGARQVGRDKVCAGYGGIEIAKGLPISDYRLSEKGLSLMRDLF